MRYRKLSPDGDYTFGNQQLDFHIDTPEAVAQVIKTSLQMWIGEWYLDVTDGTAYPEGVLGKHSKAEADATLVARIRQCQGVVDVQNFTSVIDEGRRQYSSIAANVNTIYGPTQLQLANEVNF